MKFKTYIAFVFTFIFLAKFIMVDANGMQLFSSADNITYVKPNCKKKNSPKLIKKGTDFSISQVELVTQIVELNGLCHSSIRTDFFSWDINEDNPISPNCQYFTAVLSYQYLDNDSPPPRLGT